MVIWDYAEHVNQNITRNANVKVVSSWHLYKD